MLLDAAYLLLILIAGPFYLLSRLVKRKRLASPRRRLGHVPALPRDGRPVVWFHAVSVGEALALRGLLAALRERCPDARPVITCTTVAGLEVARATYREDTVLESPYDLSFAIRRFLERTRPAALVLAELELWPNWLRACARRGIPVLVVNAKMSPSSQRGYRRLLRLWPRFLDPVSGWLAQTGAHAERIRALGVPPERVRVTGNVKFDNVVEREPGPERERLRGEHGFAPGAKVVVAGSTHRGEESALLGAFAALRGGIPELRLVLCPRHRERVPEVADLVRRNPAWRLGFRSSPAAPPDPDVLVVDSMGELSMLYALSDVAYVGGTLVPIGGHNLLEPASLGLPIVVGRHLDTVLETAAALRDAGALVSVEDEAGLPRVFADLLRDPRAGVRAAQGAREVIRAHRGSVARTMDAIAGAITPAPRPLELHAHG